MKQWVKGNAGTDEREVLAGPHEWEVGSHIFKTVLVRAIDDKHGVFSVIDMRSGSRVCRVQLTAPKSRPYEALQIISATITRLIAEKGELHVEKTIRNAEPLKM